MQTNENAIDRMMRTILGAVLLIVAFTVLGAQSGAILGIAAAAIGAILILTGLIGFCPAYKICGLSTCKVDPTRVDATTTDA